MKLRLKIQPDNKQFEKVFPQEILGKRSADCGNKCSNFCIKEVNYRDNRKFSITLNVLDHARACLKNHSRNLHAPLCRRFHPNSVAVARYGALIRAKSPTNCDAHLAESLFQTRSNPETLQFDLRIQRIADTVAQKINT